MIAKHVGGEAVKGGVYWSMSAGEFVSIPAGGGRLAGGPKDRYIRAPLPIVLIVGPLMGLAFAIFLPLSGLLVVVPLMAGKLRGALGLGRMSTAHMASQGTQLGVSYLEPRPRDRSVEYGSEAEAKDAGKLVDLAKEIAEKRWHDQGSRE